MTKVIKFTLIAFIKLYRALISPFLPSACRFYPTCSEYALLALGKYGVFRACYLIVRRLLRCHPFCKGGYDPV